MKPINKTTGMRVLAIAGLAGIAASMAGEACNVRAGSNCIARAEEFRHDYSLELTERDVEYSRLMKEDRSYAIKAFFCGLTGIALVIPTAMGLANWKRE